jgi:hypothetical protein
VPSSATAAAGPSTAGFFAGPWMEHGQRALEYMVTKHPTMFVRLVASLIPRHFEFEPKHPYSDLTDEELMQRIREIDAQLAEFRRN